MLKVINKIMKLSSRRIKHLHNINNEGFYRGFKTYVDGIDDEIEEVKAELKENNSVFLEDELGDIFWNFLCLTKSLEEEGMIKQEKVFKRCYKKFSERLDDFDDSGEKKWDKVKSIQKKELKKEHNKLYNN